LIVARRFWIPVLLGVFASLPLLPQSNQQPAKHDGTPSAQGQQPPDEDNPPEEDEEQKPEQYTFNPLKAKQVLEIGMFYMHKSQYKGAAGRFLEATKWNPGWAEAYLRLGEAQAKLGRTEDAKKSFAKVIDLAPKSKDAREAEKRSSKLLTANPH
jgi:tetratricopeptide (TPR) repeat protein